ncbi:hypothetical protein P0D73_11840 [Paraburkholderia sp. RL18-101-BIB-B]|jgi:hypothetical protein|uniref:hypothetical protein n=1 Tax=unclassified Paraburkholderia TaxID=2615204 RepID=UPI0038B9A46E
MGLVAFGELAAKGMLRAIARVNSTGGCAGLARSRGSGAIVLPSADATGCVIDLAAAVVVAVVLSASCVVQVASSQASAMLQPAKIAAPSI